MGIELPKDASEEDLADLKMAADLAAKVKKAKGDTVGAKKWGEVAQGLDVDKLSPESKEDYREALGAIEMLGVLKKDKEENPGSTETSAGPEEVKEEEIKKEPTTKRCPRCGSSVNIESQFCDMCGQTLKKADPVVSSAVKKAEEKKQAVSLRGEIKKVFAGDSGPDTELENKPDLIADFSNLRSFEDVYDHLKEMGGLTYSDGEFHSAEDIIKEIESLRKSGISSGFLMNKLTRVGNLRQTVGILIDLERPAPEAQKTQNKQEKPVRTWRRWFGGK